MYNNYTKNIVVHEMKCVIHVSGRFHMKQTLSWLGLIFTLHIKQKQQKRAKIL